MNCSFKGRGMIRQVRKHQQEFVGRPDERAVCFLWMSEYVVPFPHQLLPVYYALFLLNRQEQRSIIGAFLYRCSAQGNFCSFFHSSLFFSLSISSSLQCPLPFSKVSPLAFFYRKLIWLAGKLASQFFRLKLLKCFGVYSKSSDSKLEAGQCVSVCVSLCATPRGRMTCTHCLECCLEGTGLYLYKHT